MEYTDRFNPFTKVIIGRYTEEYAKAKVWKLVGGVTFGYKMAVHVPTAGMVRGPRRPPERAGSSTHNNRV